MPKKRNIVEVVRDWVKKNYTGDKHLIRAEYWLKKLKPDADEALVIAVITHDIERAFSEGRRPPSPDVGGAKWDDQEYNLWHGKRSAEFIERFLLDNGVSDRDLINLIKELITYHEIGGDEQKDFIKDVDSISFLENNIDLFLSRIFQDASKEEIKEKFDYMYNRITSKKAKDLARPYYFKALEKLKRV
jgi:HD superfamily phosphohydrolase YqeK